MIFRKWSVSFIRQQWPTSSPHFPGPPPSFSYHNYVYGTKLILPSWSCSHRGDSGNIFTIDVLLCTVWPGIEIEKLNFTKAWVFLFCFVQQIKSNAGKTAIDVMPFGNLLTLLNYMGRQVLYLTQFFENWHLRREFQLFKLWPFWRGEMFDALMSAVPPCSASKVMSISSGLEEGASAVAARTPNYRDHVAWKAHPLRLTFTSSSNHRQLQVAMESAQKSSKYL